MMLLNDSWTDMTPLPETVEYGGALAAVGNYIYAIPGDGQYQSFMFTT